MILAAKQTWGYFPEDLVKTGTKLKERDTGLGHLIAVQTLGSR